jgi:hypothetical protein
MKVLSDQKNDLRGSPVDGFCVFSFAWAVQTLFQVTLVSKWTASFHPIGWLAFFLATAVLLAPGRLRLFLASVVATTAHYFTQWPFVSNHVLLDTFMSLAIFGAAAAVLKTKLFAIETPQIEQRREILEKFSPVLIAMFAIMYFWIVISKMNHDFFNHEVSCMNAMYDSFLYRDKNIAAIARLFHLDFLFYLFMLIEMILPIMLVIKKTRLLAVYVGLPFHLLLGMMGHMPYSSLVISLYVLVALPAIVETLPVIFGWLGRTGQRALLWGFRCYVVVAASFFVIGSALSPGAELLGYKYQLLSWFVFAGPASLLIAFSVFRVHWQEGFLDTTRTAALVSAKPGWLWAITVVMCLNSLSPYTGFKTTGAISMYSNLRTEAGMNNHFFMPTVPIFGYQNDLVDVLDSSHPDIRKLKGHPVLYGDENMSLPVSITYFEFRRRVSQLPGDDLKISYLRNGERRSFIRGSTNNVDRDLDRRHPYWLEKIAVFRPVFKEGAFCLH